jgi:hypothetical protein
MRPASPFVGGAALCVVALLLSSCVNEPARRYRAQLDALVQQRATEARIVRELGKPFAIHRKGQPSWTDLTDFLDRASPAAWRDVRQKAAAYPTVIVYSDDVWITWIFLDGLGVMGTYSLSSQ